jgi:hypothetical protein
MRPNRTSALFVMKPRPRWATDKNNKPQTTGVTSLLEKTGLPLMAIKPNINHTFFAFNIQ